MSTGQILMAADGEFIVASSHDGTNYTRVADDVPVRIMDGENAVFSGRAGFLRQMCRRSGITGLAPEIAACVVMERKPEEKTE